MSSRAGWAALALVGIIAAPGWGGYDVRVDLKNVSGELKTNWPVILRVYTVLGRNLPPGSVVPAGLSIRDPAGRQVPDILRRSRTADALDGYPCGE